MRTLSIWIFVLGLPGHMASQPLGDAYWNKVRERADSVVISRFGAEFFAKHIFTPFEPLDYILIGDHSYDWEDRDTISRVPESCYFEYNIGFDPANASRNNIMFSITPEGNLIEDEDLRGFIAGSAPLDFLTDLDGFIALAKSNGVKCQRRAAFRVLRWVPLDTAARVHPDGEGRYELVLGRVREKKSERVANSTHTYQVVDTIVFDPFTGAILRKEERYETLGWYCGGVGL